MPRKNKTLNYYKKHDKNNHSKRTHTPGRFSKLYQTYRWRQIRAHQLTIEPLCRICRVRGIVKEATVCDHIEPHRGDMYKFWTGPFQSLCFHCHNSIKQSIEHGKTRIIGKDGYPVEGKQHNGKI